MADQTSTHPAPPQSDSLAADPTLTTEHTSHRQSTRVSKPPNRYGFSDHVSFTTTLSSVSIPSSYKQVMEHECWRKAVETELLALEENQTWDVTKVEGEEKRRETKVEEGICSGRMMVTGDFVISAGGGGVSMVAQGGMGFTESE